MSLSSRKLMETMEELRNTVNDLIELFKVTSHELRVQEKDDADIHKKLDRISGQQKVIAEALLSLSEKTTDEQQPAGPKEPMPELQQAPPQFPPQQPFQQRNEPVQVYFGVPDAAYLFQVGEDDARAEIEGAVRAVAQGDDILFLKIKRLQAGRIFPHPYAKRFRGYAFYGLFRGAVYISEYQLIQAEKTFPEFLF